MLNWHQLLGFGTIRAALALELRPHHCPKAAVRSRENVPRSPQYILPRTDKQEKRKRAEQLEARDVPFYGVVEG